MSRPRLARPSIVALIVAAAASLVAVAPANAIWVAGPSGYTGAWLGSQRSQVQCVQHSNLIFHAGPTIGRAPAYPNAIQTIRIQPRLERYDRQYGRYFIDVYGQARQGVAYPGRAFSYASQWNGDFTVGLDGVYRVSYLVRWYVSGRLVGSAAFYHHDQEINYNAMEGQRIVLNGCTMDV